MRTSYISFATATALVVLTGSAYARTLDVTSVGIGPYETVSWNAETLANGVALPTSEGYTGEILLTTPDKTYSVWCVDLLHEVYLGGQYQYSNTSLTTDNSGNNPEVYNSATNPTGSNPLSANQEEEISWLAYEGTAALNAAPANASDVSAAYQAAIWTVEYGLTGVTGPDAGFTTEYDTLIGDLAAGDAVNKFGTQISTPLNGGLFTAQNLYSSSVPEPSTWAMMGLGFAGLGFAGYRKAKAKPAFA